jgi:hypothetical protein
VCGVPIGGIVTTGLNLCCTKVLQDLVNTVSSLFMMSFTGTLEGRGEKRTSGGVIWPISKGSSTEVACVLDDSFAGSVEVEGSMIRGWRAKGLWRWCSL